MNSILQKASADLIQKLQKQNIILSDKKLLANGLQLKFSTANENCTINLYHSEKKGLSIILGGSTKSALRSEISLLLGIKSDISEDHHNWNRWVGSDESGKGDFFGPLVACGFYCQSDLVNELKDLGVKDSKLLNENDIRRIAEILLVRFKDNIEMIMLNPLTYNRLYHRFKEQGKKLNELLAWMHSRIILNQRSRHQIDGAVVDKFTRTDVLHGSLAGLQEIPILNKIKGEEDPAVAAASIIARYFYLKGMDNLSRKFGMDFPKGAGEKVLEFGKKMIKKQGWQVLEQVAKTHFKTYEQLKEK
ncbi:MAG: ribonuclease HIII [Candidatus Cloacimonetes bacterium]|nr:ribonuclease HIII [Candidatus Cloacimonadota bacterium]